MYVTIVDYEKGFKHVLTGRVGQYRVRYSETKDEFLQQLVASPISVAKHIPGIIKVGDRQYLAIPTNNQKRLGTIVNPTKEIRKVLN